MILADTLPRRVPLTVVALLAIALFAGGCSQLKRWAYERGDRDAWQQPERVIGSLAIEPGDRIADIGSGGGYFSFRLAEAVGPDGQVFAVDVDEGMNALLEEAIAERGASNITVVLGGYEDPRLEPGSIDLVFTSNTYHHIDDREAYFRVVAGALSPRGRVAIIDFKPEGWFQKRHATPASAIREEMAAAGYELTEELDYLERQSFLVFARASSR